MDDSGKRAEHGERQFFLLFANTSFSIAQARQYIVLLECVSQAPIHDVMDCPVSVTVLAFKSTVRALNEFY